MSVEALSPLFYAAKSCDVSIQQNLSFKHFKSTTYWGKVMSTLTVRILSIPSRIALHPLGVTADLIMVFASPWIKQSIRNQVMHRGGNFSSKTIFSLYPQRLTLNIVVSLLDAFLAFAVALIETGGDTRSSFTHFLTRVLSNGVTYVMLDPLLSGIADSFVMNRFLPTFLTRFCQRVRGVRASVMIKVAIVASFAVTGAIAEGIQFGLIRGVLFQNQDVASSFSPPLISGE